jgi:hypothetical protein
MLLLAGLCITLSAQPGGEAGASSDRGSLTDAQQLFFNSQFEEAAALTLAQRTAGTDDLASAELRSSSLLFQLRRLVENPAAGKDALKKCATCPALIAEFLAETSRGQTMARAALQAAPTDEYARFHLAKFDLNYVWLQLGPLKKKTGWDQYWEARHSLDDVLKQNPKHVRARVARAWIDYIVDTRMPWGTGWLLGGGSKKQAFIDMRRASETESDFYSHAEAEFALWDLHVREHDLPGATVVARRLARDFPTNRDIAAFLEAREGRP